MAHRCTTCNGLIGPEDAVGAVTQPAVCRTCRERAERREAAEQAKRNPFAETGRQRKALAMAAVIDDHALKQNPSINPFDQAGRILLAAKGWTDETWELIGVKAGYKPKPISQLTREAVLSIYTGRATAPVDRRQAS